MIAFMRSVVVADVLVLGASMRLAAGPFEDAENLLWVLVVLWPRYAN